MPKVSRETQWDKAMARWQAAMDRWEARNGKGK